MRRSRVEIAREKLELAELQGKLKKEEARAKVYGFVADRLSGGGDSVSSGLGGSPYDTASISSPATRDWTAFSGDADEENRGLQRMRERSRDLVRNSAIGAGAIRTKVSSVISSGLRLQVSVKPRDVNLDIEQVRDKACVIEKRWQMWTKESDIAGQSDFYEQQEQAYKSFLVSGDSFTLFPRLERPGSEFAFRVKVLDGDRCSNPNYTMDNDSLISGVKIGPNDGPEGYWFRFRKQLRDEWKYVPAFGDKSGRRNVVHLMRQDRPGSRRGVPMLTVIGSVVKQISRYLDAETMATVVSSFWTGFIESASDDAMESMISEIFQREGQDEGRLPEYSVTPGSIHHLRKGEKINFPAPGRPNTAFGPFMQSMMEFIGIGLEMPYEILMKHYSSSYSASRGARIDWEKVAKIDRVWFNRKWNQQVYENWLHEQVVFGKIDLPGYLEDPFIREAWTAALWTGDAAGLLDPTREVEASIKKVQEGFSTRTAEAAGLSGMDFEDIVGIQAAENELLERHGVRLGPPVNAAAAKPMQEEEDTSEEEDGAEEGKGSTESKDGSSGEMEQEDD